jgi:hypothetical protein
MSHSGQDRTIASQKPMSAVPSKGDMEADIGFGRKVPFSTHCRAQTIQRSYDIQ